MMKPEADALRARVAELQALLASTQSADLRLTVTAAIEDCERRLARAQTGEHGNPSPEAFGRARVYGLDGASARGFVEAAGQGLEP
jgi:hypothetical protein